MIRRYTTDEALEFLKKNGHTISERTYFEHKKKLREFKKERIINVVDDFVWKHFELLDTLELIQQNLWKDLEAANDINLRLKIQNSIKDNQILISKCYDAMLPVVHKQMESYGAVELANRLTYRDYKKTELKMRTKTLQEIFENPKNPREFPEKYKEKNEIIKKELEELN